MNRIAAVTVMTLRRHSRSRLLLIAGITAVLVVGVPSSQLPRMIAAERSGQAEAVQQAVDFLLTFVTFFYVLIISFITVTIGAIGIRRDISDGTVYGVLSKPLTRSEYVVGTLLGGVVVLVFSWLVYAITLGILAVLARDPLQKLEFAMLAGRCLQSIVLLSIATLLSTRCSPWVTAPLALLTYHGRDVVERLPGLDYLPDVVAEVMSFPFPVLSSLNAITQRQSQSDFDPLPILPGVIHLVDYAFVMAVLACVSFRRLDLNRPSD